MEKEGYVKSQNLFKREKPANSKNFPFLISSQIIMPFLRMKRRRNEIERKEKRGRNGEEVRQRKKERERDRIEREVKRYREREKEKKRKTGKLIDRKKDREIENREKYFFKEK